MTLEEIYYIGQTIAVVAILGSLFAIFLQQRQANRIAQTQNLVLSDSYQATLRAFMENEDLAEIFRKAMFEQTPLSPTETTRIMFYLNLMVTTHRDVWMADGAGLAADNLLREFDANTAWYLSKPLFLAEWQRLQANGQFNGGFGDHINGLIEPHEAIGSEPKDKAELEARA